MKPEPAHHVAERAVIGYLFGRQNEIYELGLETEHFYLPKPRRALEAIRALADAGEDAGAMNVEIWTRENDGPDLLWDEIQRWEYDADTLYPKHAARVIKDAALDRAVRLQARAVVADDENHAAALLAEAQSAFSVLASDMDQGGTERLGETTMAVLEDYERAQSGEAATALSFGEPTLDQYCLLDAGSVMVIAGRPSMGKSALCQYLTTGLARAGERILIFTTEVSKKKAARRFLARAARMNSNAIVSGTANAGEQAAMGTAAIDMANLSIWFNDTCADVKTISTEIRRMKRLHKITAVVIDHIQECIPQEDPNREIGQLISAVRSACRDDPKTALIMVSQLNRRVEQRENKQPNLSDLRDSGTIEQVADSVLLCYRPAYYATQKDRAVDQGLMQVGVAKNRDGKTGIIQMSWDYDNGYVLGVRDGRYE